MSSTLDQIRVGTDLGSAKTRKRTNKRKTRVKKIVLHCHLLNWSSPASVVGRKAMNHPLVT